MSENKTGKANRVKGKNVHGRVVVLTRSKPEQLALFQTFLPEEEEKYSNTNEASPQQAAGYHKEGHYL
jgi:hypothetical protein